MFKNTQNFNTLMCCIAYDIENVSRIPTSSVAERTLVDVMILQRLHTHTVCTPTNGYQDINQLSTNLQ